MQDPNQQIITLIKQMADRWPSAVVARTEVGRFTGGMVSAKSMANYDSQREGVSERIMLGSRKVGYPVDALCRWLEARLTMAA